jgi:hypothetical protein
MSVTIRPVSSYVADPAAKEHYLPRAPDRLLKADTLRRTPVRFRSGSLTLATHNHIELYDQDPYVSEACGHAVRWLDAHIKNRLDRAADSWVSSPEVKR